MFDIGFSEILMFGAMALIVLGPEKLPQAARAAGKWYAKIRFTIANVQHEIEQELDIAETRRAMQEELAKIRQAEASMKKELAEIRGSVQNLHQHQPQEDSIKSESPKTISKPDLESEPTNTNISKKPKTDISATDSINIPISESQTTNKGDL